MRRRLVAVLAGAGVVLAPLPSVADVPSGPGRGASAGTSLAGEGPAARLLASSVTAGHSVDYSGTQFLATWGAGGSRSVLVDVTHEAASRPVLSPSPSGPPGPGSPGPSRTSVPMTATPLTATASLDPRRLAALVAAYDLSVAAPGRCTGRVASVVEAHHQDGSLAGRFWIDDDTDLLLRREVYDGRGNRLRSSAFLDLEVAGPSGSGSQEPSVEGSAGRGLPATELTGLGWRIPEELPAGFRLIEARESALTPDSRVLHAAYSDGLSTLSLFGQQGRLGSGPPAGFSPAVVGDRPVWVRHDGPERVVWSGDGRVWTLVSDAPQAAVTAAVAALPRDREPSTGSLARLGRGLARLGGLLNPFD